MCAGGAQSLRPVHASLAETTERIQHEIVARTTASEALLLAALSYNECPPACQPPHSQDNIHSRRLPCGRWALSRSPAERRITFSFHQWNQNRACEKAPCCAPRIISLPTNRTIYHQRRKIAFSCQHFAQVGFSQTSWPLKRLKTTYLKARQPSSESELEGPPAFLRVR